MKSLAIFTCGVLLLVAVSAVAMMETGPADLTINGGGRGDVPFPHHRHQSVLKDCSVCHDLFPQKLGGISELKEKNELEKKQIMNDPCIKCHRERKKAGENAGPITCSKCHVK